MSENGIDKYFLNESIEAWEERVLAEIPAWMQPEPNISEISEIAANLGTFEEGALSFGNQTAWGDGRTGVFMAYPGYTFDATTYDWDTNGDVEAHMGGVAEDVLQWWGNATDGIFYFGGGAGWLTATGLKLEAELNEIPQSIQWLDTSDNEIGRLRFWYSGSTSQGSLTTNNDRTITSAALALEAKNGGSTSTYIDMQSGAQDYINIGVDGAELLQLDQTETVFNETGLDIDHRIETDTLTHAWFLQGSDGFVGINEATPTERLHIGAGNILTDDTDFYMQDSNVSHVGLNGYSNSQYARIGINSATAGGLTVSGFRDSSSTNQAALRLAGTLDENPNTGSGTAKVGIITVEGRDTNDGTPSGNEILITWRAKTTTRGLLQGDGDMFIDGTYQTYSDGRWKDNITPLGASKGLAAILALRPVTYNRIRETRHTKEVTKTRLVKKSRQVLVGYEDVPEDIRLGSELIEVPIYETEYYTEEEEYIEEVDDDAPTYELSELTQMGFIAQDVQRTPLGDAVIGEATADDILSLDYKELIAPMVLAIQELNKKAESLEAQLAR